MTSARRDLRAVLILLAGAVVILLAWWFAVAVYQVSWGAPKALAEKQAYILREADHGRIVEEASEMLANVANHPHVPGDAFPQNMPSYLQSLEPSSLHIYPGEGVLITFGREFALYVTDATAAGVPPPIAPMAPTQIYPGLWHFTY